MNTDKPVLQELEAVIGDLKEGVLNRWHAKAQKGALTEWQQRDDAPGVRARFTEKGAKAMGFAQRSMAYTKDYVVVEGKRIKLDGESGTKHKGDLPPFVYRGRAGGFMGKVLQRKPRTKRNANAVSTRLSIMGGVLNLLSADNQRGFLKQDVKRQVENDERGPFTRNVPKGPIQVKQHPFKRVTFTFDTQVSPRTYAEEFAVTDADRQFVRQRTDVLLMEIYRKEGFTKRGKRKRSKFKVV